MQKMSKTKQKRTKEDLCEVNAEEEVFDERQSMLKTRHVIAYVQAQIEQGDVLGFQIKMDEFYLSIELKCRTLLFLHTSYGFDEKIQASIRLPRDWALFEDKKEGLACKIISYRIMNNHRAWSSKAEQEISLSFTKKNDFLLELDLNYPVQIFLNAQYKNQNRKEVNGS